MMGGWIHGEGWRRCVVADLAEVNERRVNGREPKNKRATYLMATASTRHTTASSPPADQDVADDTNSTAEPAAARLDSEVARRSSRLDLSKSSGAVARCRPPAAVRRPPPSAASFPKPLTAPPTLD
jgi:hypothetical protein